MLQSQWPTLERNSLEVWKELLVGRRCVRLAVIDFETMICTG